jgi:hypothetical protein
MSKIKISKMNVQQLSWGVATITQPDWVTRGLLKVFPDDLEMDDGQMYLPASNFAQGAELLSQECISVVHEAGVWTAFVDVGGVRESVQTGSTMLEAGMRTYLDIFNDGAYFEIPCGDLVGDDASFRGADNDNLRVVDVSVMQPELF